MKGGKVKVTIEDPWLGKRDVSTNLALIADQHKLLCRFRDDGRKPSQHLLEDIQVYEYILKHPNAEQKAEDYLREKNRLCEERKSFSVEKIEVARNLGWFQ